MRRFRGVARRRVLPLASAFVPDATQRGRAGAEHASRSLSSSKARRLTSEGLQGKKIVSAGKRSPWAPGQRLFSERDTESVVRARQCRQARTLRVLARVALLRGWWSANSFSIVRAGERWGERYCTLGPPAGEGQGEGYCPLSRLRERVRVRVPRLDRCFRAGGETRSTDRSRDGARKGKRQC